MLGDRLPPITREQIAAAVTLVEATPTPRAERALADAALVLADRIVDGGRRLVEATARLHLVTERSTRDPSTGLANREGLRRWLGGSATEGLAMPPIGVVVIVLDGVTDVDGGRPPDVSESLLQAIAAVLTTNTRPGDLIVRCDGDTFVVLGAGLAGDDLMLVAGRLLGAISLISSEGSTITAAAGVQTCRSRPLPISTSIDAMAAAKRAGGRTIVAVGSGD